VGDRGRTVALLLTASFLLPFVINVAAGRHGSSDGGLVATILFIILVYQWYSLDRRARRYDSSPFLNLAVMLVAIVGLPVYFVRSRGWKGGLAASALAFAVLLVSVALSAAGMWAGQALAAQLGR
jgi:hypothetical protein